MKKFFNFWVLVTFASSTLFVVSCKAQNKNTTEVELTEEEVTTYKRVDEPVAAVPATSVPVKPATPAAPASDMVKIQKGKKVYNIYNYDDASKVYKTNVVKANCFLVMSKSEFRMYVYEVVGKDTLLVAHFPVCYARNVGNKTRQGDSCTPECDMRATFRICQIQNSSSWTHDFKDGRGSFLAYGPWFMRLDLKGTKNNASVCSNRSIGIHGSSGNEESVPGRDSEGCIRLRNNDLRILHDNFAQMGTKVVVKPYGVGKYAFEKKAEQRLGNEYKRQVKGNPLTKKYPVVK